MSTRSHKQSFIYLFIIFISETAIKAYYTVHTFIPLPCTTSINKIGLSQKISGQKTV